MSEVYDLNRKKYIEIKQEKGEDPDVPGRETEEICKMIDKYKEQLMFR